MFGFRHHPGYVEKVAETDAQLVRDACQGREAQGAVARFEATPSCV